MWREIEILATASTLGAMSAAGSATAAPSGSNGTADARSLARFMCDSGAPTGSYAG